MNIAQNIRISLKTYKISLKAFECYSKHTKHHSNHISTQTIYHSKQKCSTNIFYKNVLIRDYGLDHKSLIHHKIDRNVSEMHVLAQSGPP